MANRLKKWFMLQIWRLQQVSQILTLLLMAGNLSLLIWGYMKWRGEILGSYAGVIVILLILTAIIWLFAFMWDIRLKMWREQMTVLTERNPYAKERMAAKEIAIYEMLWIPLMEKLGKDDPKMRKAAVELRTWMDRLHEEDPVLARDLEDIYKYMGKK